MDPPPFLLLLLLLTSCTYLQPARSRPHNNITDLESLLAFKAHVTDSSGILSKNWTTNTSFCNWIGVTCSNRHQRVSSLNLYNKSLHGTISPHLANLSFVSFLNLGKNSLTGFIPEVLSQLSRLRTLVLEQNFLYGHIPPNLFNISSLISINLSANNLTGSLPSNNSISMPPHLKIASLGNNQLTGKIPSSFSRCLDLQVLSLSFSNYSGTIPAEFGFLRNLRLLYLYNNLLQGKIPSSLGNLTMLRGLELGRNNLEGEIPEELGNLSALQDLLLSENDLSGSIPSHLLNASMISILTLDSNRLTGSVPDTFGASMPLLEYLLISGNQLTGRLNFITSLANCRNLGYLAFSTNDFDGSLPRSVGNLSVNLLDFYAAENRISGNIPAELGNLSSLLLLSMAYNEFTGGIPSELSRLHRLQGMYLLHNRINGSIPSEFGLLERLSYLDCQGNKLSGPVPGTIGNITGLVSLSLSANRLSSNIPQSLWTVASFIELNLSQNALSGSIPSAVGNLKSLYTLDLSENQLSGNISSALGELQMLSYADLSGNLFHGEIPQSLGGLISINQLNLSRNFLSGVIPKSLANLHHLYSLDLSFNMLTGEIPKGRVFSNKSIPSLVGNRALCGAPQLNFPPCSSNIGPHPRRILHLLKFILPVIFLAVVLSFLYLIFTIHQRRKVRNLVSTESPRLGDHRVISYHELVRATDNFTEANLLGRGSFGSVFKGCLDDGLIVAVKVLDLEVEGASKSFDAECQALCRVRHRNLIKIISVCCRLDFKALILEYMPNRSLEHCLYSENCLSMLQRLNIMLDVSSALEYLHHHHPEVILHSDLKPSNILLDEEMVAHVSDFGIAKLLLGSSTSMASASTAGTVGYIAPEYGSTGKVSKMGDVYSFGILLLETFTGKKPTDITFDGESSLRECIFKAYPFALLDIVDANLFRDGSLRTSQHFEEQNGMPQCLSNVIELGLLCSSYSPKDRIPMIDVVPKLQKIKVEYLSQLSSA